VFGASGRVFDEHMWCRESWMGHLDGVWEVEDFGPDVLETKIFTLFKWAAVEEAAEIARSYWGGNSGR